MSLSAAPLLEVSGLVKRYGGLVAIDHVDLQLRAGTITGVIGPNGAGKSTLIGLIGGAVAPSEGSIRLDGRDVSPLPASERARAGIGRTYQIPRPFLDMTVGENIEVAQYSIAPFIRAAQAREERGALLALTGLADVARLPARKLPLLRRKRLEVARALALKPRIVLFDEVGAGLVDNELTELIALIRSIADPRTAIVIVEHVLRVVRECCARSIVLNFGKKLIEGPTTEIFANDEVAAVYLGTGDARATLEARDRQARRAIGKRGSRRGPGDGGPHPVAADRAANRQRRPRPAHSIARGLFGLWPGAGLEGDRPDDIARSGRRHPRRQRRRQDNSRAHDIRLDRADGRRAANRRRKRLGPTAASHRRPRRRSLHGGAAHFSDADSAGKSADRSP